jgi:hypothetical protein
MCGQTGLRLYDTLLVALPIELVFIEEDNRIEEQYFLLC